MLNSFYLFIIPILVALFYVGYKYYLNREKINDLENNAFVDLDKRQNNLLVAEEKIFVFLDGLRSNFYRSLLFCFHWVLHFFVIFLGFVSDTTDYLYSQARDFFLKTATKEKGMVSTFWEHLKEYKKEKEEENKN